MKKTGCHSCLKLVGLLALSAMVLLASEYHGQVMFGGLPVPGVAVTATQDDKKVSAITDGMGSFSFPELADGKWSVEVAMSGFSTLKQDITVGPGAPGLTWDLKLKSLSEIQAQVQAAPALEPRPAQAASGTPKPTPPAAAKPKPTVQAAAGTPAAPGAAAAGTTPTPATEAASEASQQAADGFLVNGSQVNGGSSPFALNPAFGNNRRGPKSLYTYQVAFNLGNSALNANNYSLTGQATPKPSYNDITFNGSVQGPIRIPHIVRNGPTFFINYLLTRNRNATNTEDLVPTLAQRNGDLSSITTPIVNPSTQMPFAGNIIPKSQISPQAAALLNYYPMPNFNSARFNYQAAVVNVQHVDAFRTNVQKQIGRKNSFTGTFALQDTRSNTPNASGFPFLDTSSALGMNLNPQWRHQFTQRFSTVFQYQFTRQATHAYSYFENRTNVSGNAGIEGNLQSPTYWGPPSLVFGASGITPMSDISPSFIRPETNTVKADTTWNHGRHTVTFGADSIRQQFNFLNETNPRGIFSFTGGATGSDLADFLLGIPDSSTLAYGNADKYLRAPNYDAYIQDDWRVNSALTVLGGIRWEYGGPASELYGRLVNLDVAPGFSAVAPVVGNDPVGSITGTHYPGSLLNPDRHGFEPSIGIAWRPISGSSLVVRAGYSLRYTTSVYQAIATQMDQQAPLSTSVIAENSPTNPLTLANGFTAAPGSESTTFGIDPNFKIGYAQNWNITIQKDLPWGMQMQANYTGLKGTRLAQEFYPNSYPLNPTAPNEGNPCPSCPVGFLYETSNGNSTRNAAYLQLRRRLHNGFTAQWQYTYAKAIDDVPTGSGASAAAQNWQDLSGERGLSSFDQRQNITATLQYTSGLGIGGGNLLSGWRAAVLKEWTIVLPITWGTGLPLNPNYTALLGGTATSAPLRPNFTTESLSDAPAGYYFNPAALAPPVPGTFGDAARDSITGPYKFSLNASLQRTFRVNDRVTLTTRVDSTNTLNHVVVTNYGVTYGSPQLGAATAVNQMRQMTATARFNF